MITSEKAIAFSIGAITILYPLVLIIAMPPPTQTHSNRLWASF